MRISDWSSDVCSSDLKPDIVRYPRQAFVEVNGTGTLNLIEAAVATGNDRFLFTSTTSLMVRADVRAGADEAGAWWMDEDFGPIEPRNIYGITKLAAEQAVKLVHREQGINVAILRTGRFFPEDDDTHAVRSEEHTSELQSLMRISYAVFCLKKKTTRSKHKDR